MLTTSDRRQPEREGCSNWPGDGIFKKFLAEAVAAQETVDRADDAPANRQESLLMAKHNYLSGKP